MRPLILVLLAACGGGGSDGLEVQESQCAASRFHYVHDLSLGDGVVGGEGDLSTSGHAFVNAGIRDAEGNILPGSLEVFSGGTGANVVARVEFTDLLADGDTVDARGYVKLPEQGIDAGNCETAELAGRITALGDGWRFTLLDLHASPYCSGSAIVGSFAGCIRGN